MNKLAHTWNIAQKLGSKLSDLCIECLLERPIARQSSKFDIALIWMVVLMTSFSLMMIYSASIVTAVAEGSSKWFYFNRQVIFLLFGLIAAMGVMCVRVEFFKKHALKIIFASIVLLGLVLVAGREINGARRWIHLGPFNAQPTEIFKLAVIFYLSSFFTRRVEILKHAKKVLLSAIPVGLGLFLVILEPDFGSFVVTTVIWVSLLFLSGFPWKWFGATVSLGLVVIGCLIVVAPYRMARVTAFLHPWDDPLGKGYQLTHSLMAIARGEWLGVGLGASLEKRYYLPEAHTDFIFAVIGEEFGFVGMCLLVFCYCWLVIRAFSIGKLARDSGQYFGAYVAQGIGMWLGIQSFFNIGVNVGILPTKGLTLPLMSYGGSAVIVMMVCMGLLLRIDYECRAKRRGAL